jgi:ABC-type glycerol-3-phosphate transport system substrate-binding protein
MKNKILTAIILITIPFTLTACNVSNIPVIGKYLSGGGGGNDSPAPEKPVTISFWGVWEKPDVMDSVFSRYKMDKPHVTVNYDDRSVLGADQYKETVITRLKEGVAPDVVLVHNSWLPYILDYLSPAPVETISASDYTQKYYPVASDVAVRDNQVYAVPWYYDGLVLVYNKDHFSEIDQLTPPTAWEEFRRIALALTVKAQDGQFVRAGAAIGAADNIDFATDILGLMFAQANITVPDNIDSKSAQDALDFYTLFVKSDGVWNKSLPEASKAFSAGKVSMIFLPTWNLMDIIEANPNMNIGVAPVPQAVAERPVSWGSFWMYAVPKSSSNQKAAWDLIKYITDDQQQDNMFRKASETRPYGPPFASKNLIPNLDTYPTSVFLKPVINTAPFAKSSYFSARSGNKLEVDALREAIESVLTGQTSETALTDCKKKLTGTTSAR